MAKTTRAIESLYLDPEKLELLKRLAAETRIPRSVLLREAVDDLLVKHKMLRAPRNSKPKKRRPPMRKHRRTPDHNHR